MEDKYIEMEKTAAFINDAKSRFGVLTLAAIVAAAFKNDSEELEEFAEYIMMIAGNANECDE